MEVFSCFDDLFAAQGVVSGLSVFNADLYLGNSKVRLSELPSIIKVIEVYPF